MVALTLPAHDARCACRSSSGFVLDGLPGWREVLSLPVAERMPALMRSRRAPPPRRGRQRRRRPGCSGASPNWRGLELIEAFAPENQAYEGRTIGRLVDGARRRPRPFDVLLDIVVADELRTGLRPAGMDENAERLEAARRGVARPAHRDRRIRRRRPPRHDVRRHLLPPHCSSHGVREFGVVSLEEAVHQLTDVPARLYGLPDRGRIADGADRGRSCCSTPTRVGYHTERIRDDLPGGAWRLYADATGISKVLVNGVTVVDDGDFTGATPGHTAPRRSRHPHRHPVTTRRRTALVRRLDEPYRLGTP